MPRGGLFFLLLIVTTVGLLTLLWPMIPSARHAINTKKSPISFIKISPEQQLAVDAYRKTPPAEVSQQVLMEAARSGRLDQDPAASEKRLDLLAEQLSDTDIRSMAEIAKTPSNNGDLRALAVELLARNKAPKALESLEQIILSKWPASTDPRVTGFEQSIRARAIEGLEGHPSPQATEVLQKALSRTEDAFLNDHAQRAMLHRKGQARSVEEQDQEALNKILQR